jgi:hypothetical protein
MSNLLFLGYIPFKLVKGVEPPTYIDGNPTIYFFYPKEEIKKLVNEELGLYNVPSGIEFFMPKGLYIELSNGQLITHLDKGEFIFEGVEFDESVSGVIHQDNLWLHTDNIKKTKAAQTKKED